MATGTMRVMGRKGDTRITWDRNDEKSVERARAEMEAMRRGGVSFFGRKPRGKRTTQIREFDPSLAEIMVVPAIAGG